MIYTKTIGWARILAIVHKLIDGIPVCEIDDQNTSLTITKKIEIYAK